MTHDIALHKNLLLNILQDIFTDFTIAPYLGFKGGTAAMIFHDLSRFSVDLDFDLLQLDQAKVVAERIENLIKSYGTLKESKSKRFGHLFILSYHNKNKDAKNVKIEINFKKFGARYEIKRYLGIAINTMVEEDMVACKMMAMFERMGKANRDIYDVWFFLKNNRPINTKLIEQRMNMPYKDFLEACIQKLENIDGHHILSGLGELLTPQQKVWCKAKLISDTLFLLRLALVLEDSNDASNKL